MVNWLAASLLAAATAVSVRADTPSGRANHGCALLGSTIFCYGGATRAADGTTTALNSNLFYYLDLSEEKSVTDLRGSWTAFSGGNVGPNYYFAITALPTGNSFVIDGGRGAGTDGLTTQAITVLFNATGQGSWSTDIPSGGHPLVDSHTAVSDADNNVYLIGGRSSAFYSNITGPMQFPTQMAIFRPPETWSSTPATLRSTSTQTRLHHKAVMGRDGHTIYYVGGVYPAQAAEQGSAYYYGHVPMNDILIYDTSSSTWSTRNATGLLPTPRMDHTLTMKPSTGELIVYGGTQLDSSQPIGDFFYILDTQDMTWSNQSLTAADGANGAGARFGHEAVLVNNSSLYIIFGANQQGSTPGLFLLDIESYQWQVTSPAVHVDSSDGGPNGGIGNGDGDLSSGDGGGDSDNIGTIVGAVVGSVAGIGIIGAALFFFRRRRSSKNNHDGNLGSSDHMMSTHPKEEANDESAAYRDDDSYAMEIPTRQFLPAYTSGKPDAVPEGEEQPPAPRLVMQAVKPDGA
ncbi:hypothetical protein BDB00DRAFT_795437 [Zychaea mexicana]|uniref:uncharacterized protein n=1 Tax=Zychaea mexicana TaxID=64656 RepID=UPI0022FEE946|nr:uncharacterized protein BDB00DRAFT_795437 [Zychaea mexicana]KAI9499105.1 hypothetical protein BDB00DRAFT_795437 [Zychaea mexicana]